MFSVFVGFYDILNLVNKIFLIYMEKNKICLSCYNNKMLYLTEKTDFSFLSIKTHFPEIQKQMGHRHCMGKTDLTYIP